MNELTAVSGHGAARAGHAAKGGGKPGPTEGDFAGLFRLAGHAVGKGKSGDQAADKSGAEDAVPSAASVTTETLPLADGRPVWLAEGTAATPDSPAQPQSVDVPAGADPVSVVAAEPAMLATEVGTNAVASASGGELAITAPGSAANDAPAAAAPAATGRPDAKSGDPATTKPAKSAPTDLTAAAEGAVAALVKGEAQPGAKTAPSTGATAAPPGAQAIAGDGATPSTATVVASGAHADMSGEQGDPSSRRGPGTPPASAVAARAAESDAASVPGGSDAAASLQDIVRALPPVVQAQLDPARAFAATAALQAGPSAGAQLGERMIDMSVQGQWIDRMAEEIAALSEGNGHTRFQLSPPNLGRIQVDLWQRDEATHVRLLTETDEAARRLREGQGALESHARMAALPLGSVSVEKSNAAPDTGRDQANAQNPRQGGEPGQQSRQAGQDDQSGARGRVNQSGFAAVMGDDRPAETATQAPPARVADPRVRFA